MESFSSLLSSLTALSPGIIRVVASAFSGMMERESDHGGYLYHSANGEIGSEYYFSLLITLFSCRVVVCVL